MLHDNEAIRRMVQGQPAIHPVHALSPVHCLYTLYDERHRAYCMQDSSVYYAGREIQE